MPETVMDADAYADDTWECRLCGAPGGFPYCNDACRDADQPDGDAPLLATDLTVGDNAPNGIPIVCCGAVMTVEGDADSRDWACLDCNTTVAAIHGRVDSITR